MSNDPFRPYQEAHANTAGAGDSRPTALQIVEDNDRLGNLTGKVALVTGGTSGIGVETVRALHATGADVFFTARDPSKAEATKAEIATSSSGKGRLEAIDMDLTSLASVRKAADDFLARSGSVLNILVNNAGIMAVPNIVKSHDGFESQLAVNHLAHYLLIRLVLPALESSSTPEFNSRVVNVSSMGHLASPFLFDDYNFDAPDSYQAFKAYGQSKTANIWTANYIDRVYGPRGVHALSLHPGGIWTGLQVHVESNLMDKWRTDPTAIQHMKSTAQGAATSIWAAIGKIWEGNGGKYLEDCAVSVPTEASGPNRSSGYAEWAYDDEAAGKLWELSAKLVGVQ